MTCAAIPAGPEKLLRLKVEGAALRRSLQDQVVRPWARDAIDAWERRIDLLIERDVSLRPAGDPGGPIVGAAGGAGGYEPGAQLWWLELRIDQRMAELAEIIDGLADARPANGRKARNVSDHVLWRSEDVAGA